MGYLKIICEGPAVNKNVEDLLCLAIGQKLAPDNMWYDYNVDDHEFLIMGLTAKQTERLINYIYERLPDYSKKLVRFRMIGYSESEQKPRDSWEALNYMLQAFPKRRRFKDGT